MAPDWTIRSAWSGVDTALRLLLVARHAGIGTAGAMVADRLQRAFVGPRDYPAWVERHATVRPAERRRLARLQRELLSGPRFGVVMLSADPELDVLGEAIASLCAQVYPRWSLLVCAPPSALAALAPAHRDPRIEWLPHQGGHAPLPPLLARVGGDFVACLDGRGLLADVALLAIASELTPGVDIVYTDDDARDDRGRPRAPRFKPDFDPELLARVDYLGPLCFLRMTAVAAADGPRDLHAGAESLDLTLRCARGAGAGAVRHLPFVLYHARRESAPPEPAAACAVVAADLAARGQPAAVVPGERPGTRRVHRARPAALVSILIPTRDRPDLLHACVTSIERSACEPYELIVIDNGSRDERTRTLLGELAASGRARVLADARPFNYSALNNLAAESARGELLCLLNDDVEALGPGWLGELAAQASRPGVGAVGARLVFPDGRLQHAGVTLGIGGVAGHVGRGRAPGEEDVLTAHVRTVSAVTGACLMVERALYLQVGGLDAVHLPVALNDVDFCLRLSERGRRNLWTPHALLLHHESATRGLDDRFANKRRLWGELAYMQRRWGARLLADPYYNPNLTLASEQGELAWPPRVRAPWRRNRWLLPPTMR